jgi:hypothetical protein
VTPDQIRQVYDTNVFGVVAVNHRGHRTVEQGARIAVRLATLGTEGPTGTFQDENGAVPW